MDWVSRIVQRLDCGVQYTLSEHAMHRVVHDYHCTFSVFLERSKPRRLRVVVLPVHVGAVSAPSTEQTSVTSYLRFRIAAVVKMLNALGKQTQGRLHTPLQFSSEVLRHEALVGRLARQHCLDAHNGCVNTVEWNEQGNLLLSGSDDHCITLWRWPEGRPIQSQDPSYHRCQLLTAELVPL